MARDVEPAVSGLDTAAFVEARIARIHLAFADAQRAAHGAHADEDRGARALLLAVEPGRVLPALDLRVASDVGNDPVALDHSAQDGGVATALDADLLCTADVAVDLRDVAAVRLAFGSAGSSGRSSTQRSVGFAAKHRRWALATGINSGLVTWLIECASMSVVPHLNSLLKGLNIYSCRSSTPQCPSEGT